jgi:SAM-dependent methyltransferase
VSLTVLTGLPGSGKSKYLIEQVLAARAQRRPVKTFECSESPWLQADEYVRDWRLIGSRILGLECALDHFVTTAESAEILSETSPETLVAFEEAHYFDLDIVQSWLHASARGLEVLVAMPSVKQLARLDGNEYSERRFAIQCGRCGEREAVSFVMLPDAEAADPEATTALCEVCDAEVTAEARRDIVDRLERGAPYPGDKTIYQPVELEECADWWCLRPDSEKRFEILTRVLRDAGLVADPELERPEWSSVTYVDVGCNTGFFCSRAREQFGFYVEGVDIVQADIELARLLGSFIRRQKVNYVVSDCYEYLRDTRDQVFDVTSAFSVFQWLMLQRTAQHGLECIDWLFEKTGRVCFLEMGYNEEEIYRGKLPLEIDRAWMEKRMERGSFADVRIFDAAEHGLQRDLFVGIKEPAPMRVAARAAETQGGAR